jgi:6-pyruvoyltetrahydropterin/6-carboxytetrahydropterin synthase
VSAPHVIYEIVKRASFEAAHNLLRHEDPARQETARYLQVHGHSFQVEAAVRGPLDPDRAWVADFAQISSALGALAGQLDHRLLNEIPGLETATLEQLARWFMDNLIHQFPTLSRVTVSRPSLGESCTLTIEAT